MVEAIDSFGGSAGGGGVATCSKDCERKGDPDAFRLSESLLVFSRPRFSSSSEITVPGVVTLEGGTDGTGSPRISSATVVASSCGGAGEGSGSSLGKNSGASSSIAEEGFSRAIWSGFGISPALLVRRC